MRSLPKLGQLECTEFKKTLPLLSSPLHRHFTTYVWECTCNIPLSLNHFTLKTQKNLPSFVARSKFCSQRLCCCIYSCLSYLQFRSFFQVVRLLAIVVIIGGVIPICGYTRHRPLSIHYTLNMSPAMLYSFATRASDIHTYIFTYIHNC